MMHPTTTYLGAYWGARPEELGPSSERLARCLRRLADADPLLTDWFHKGTSRRAARTPLDTSRGSLASVLAAGRNRRDVGGEVIEELGFSAGMWNGARDGSDVGLRVRVGGWGPSGNAFVLNFPRPGGAASVYEPGTAARIVQAVIEAWEPDWATWTTDEWRSAQSETVGVPVVGWFTYLRGYRGVDVAGSEDAFGGILVRAAETIEEVHPDRIMEVRDQFVQAGVLDQGRAR